MWLALLANAHNYKYYREHYGVKTTEIDLVPIFIIAIIGTIFTLLLKWYIIEKTIRKS